MHASYAIQVADRSGHMRPVEDKPPPNKAEQSLCSGWISVQLGSAGVDWNPRKVGDRNRVRARLSLMIGWTERQGAAQGSGRMTADRALGCVLAALRNLRLQLCRSRVIDVGKFFPYSHECGRARSVKALRSDEKIRLSEIHGMEMDQPSKGKCQRQRLGLQIFCSEERKRPLVLIDAVRRMAGLEDD